MFPLNYFTASFCFVFSFQFEGEEVDGTLILICSYSKVMDLKIKIYWSIVDVQ